MSDGDSVLDDEELVFVTDDENRNEVEDSADDEVVQELPPVEDVQRRLRRFATLRAAQRAIAPSVAALREDAAQTRGQRLRERLEALAGQWKTLDASEVPDSEGIAQVCQGFEAIDAELTALSDELRAHADGIDAAQLRSTLPDIAQRHRREVCGLLDLLIADAAGLASRRPTIEYVVTLLSTTDDGSTRKIAHDPARLTPEMEVLCEGIQAEYGAVSEEYELAFFEAANVDASVDVAARVRELRAKKEELGTACLLPGVLRAIVTYNVRMANEMSSSVRTSRQDDLAFEDLVDSVEFERSEVATEETEPEANLDFVAPDLKVEAAPVISIHDSKGIEQIWDALRRRLRKVPIGSCTSERVALAVDLTPLDADELTLLGTGESDEDGRTTAAILLVGLLNGVFPAIEQSLLELGVTRKQLYEDWAQELDQDLQERISSLLASNAYERACRLSEFKTRHLYASLSTLARERRDRDGIRPKARPAQQDSAKADMIAAARDAQAELVGSMKGKWSDSVRSVALGETGQARKVRGGIAAVACVAMVAALAFNFIGSTKSEVTTMPPRQLSEFSPHLQSAYRNGRGDGGLLIGRVDETWKDLTPKERSVAALEMRERLLAENVRDAMIYDSKRRLQIHLASGELRRPEIVAGARAEMETSRE